MRWKNIINHPYLYTSHYRTWCWDNTKKKLWSNLDSFYIYSRCQKFMYTYHGCDYPGNSGLLIIYLNFIYFWWNYCTPHFLKEVVSKISPPDVSRFETTVNWILFSYHFQFKCINPGTVDTVGQITPRLFTLEKVLKLCELSQRVSDSHFYPMTVILRWGVEDLLNSSVGEGCCFCQGN